jgi:DNA-binding SARP family transcriptional activator
MWCHGQLGQALESTSAWTQPLARPWMIAALADAGQVQEAVDLLERARTVGLGATSLEAVVAPRVLTDAGRREDALEALARGRRLARAGQSLLYELAAEVEEARLRLRLDRDPLAALAALDRVDRHPLTHRSRHLGPAVDGWYGLALLLDGRDAEALDRLRRSVASQRGTGMMLHLPAAAVYLAEAEWRVGHEDAADAAADLALEAARAQGFNHMLLLALRDFPAVLSRRMDAEPAGDSPWHELGRALHAQDLGVEVSNRPSVQLLEFGRLAIEIEGEEVRPGIAKIHELLAYLLTRPHRRAGRAELLDALFDARADDATRSYLRQVVHRLRLVLPPDGVVSDRGSVGLSDDLAVMSESVELERALAQAAGLRGGYRLAATLDALRAVDQGAYLPGIESPWVQQRRQQLRELATDARFEAAQVAFAEGRLRMAEELTEAVLADEPYHEPSWRLAMRLAGARGDDHGVLRAYQRCERVLAEVGAEPSATTRQLVDRLRR